MAIKIIVAQCSDCKYSTLPCCNNDSGTRICNDLVNDLDNYVTGQWISGVVMNNDNNEFVDFIELKENIDTAKVRSIVALYNIRYPALKATLTSLKIYSSDDEKLYFRMKPGSNIEYKSSKRTS